MKYLLLGGMVLIASVQFNANADDSSGSLYLAGVIPVVTTIAVNPVAGSDGLNLLAQAADLSVATVSERNNTERGYDVTLQSKHGGNFEIEKEWRAGHFNKIPYTAQYDGNTVVLSRHPRKIYKSAHHNLTSQARDINFSISYDAQDPTTKLAGTYSDTLTFTITAR